MSTHWTASSISMETRSDLGFHLHRAARGPGQGDSVAPPPSGLAPALALNSVSTVWFSLPFN